MKESNIQSEISIELSKSRHVRLFRNNVAQCWTGEVIQKDKYTVTIANYRILHAGLFVGSSDLIGLETITVTPEMVGQQIARFTGIEVKTEGGRIKKEQLAWQNFINTRGGKAVICRSVEEAKEAFGV